MDQAGYDALLQDFYAAQWAEADRLIDASPAGRVEFVRVQELLRARLAPGSRVLDVGGATGIHAQWLAADGHAVTLVDPVPVQVEAARRIGTFEAVVGDARSLPFTDGSFDAVLVFGPLYHLRDRVDRVAALREAVRVVRPGGLVCAAAISRLSVAAYRLTSPWWDRGDEGWLDLVNDGRPEEPPVGFPGAHFHTSAELEAELADAGLAEVESEGIDGFVVGAEYLGGTDDELTSAMLVLARRLARVDGAKDTSGHLFATGLRPD